MLITEFVFDIWYYVLLSVKYRNYKALFFLKIYVKCIFSFFEASEILLFFLALGFVRYMKNIRRSFF